MKVTILVFAVTSAFLATAASDGLEQRLSLAASLKVSGDYTLSALQCRMMAAELEPGDPALPSLYLSAAESYGLARQWNRMEKMLDAAADEGASETALAFLRMRHAEGRRDWISAAEYAEELATTCKDSAPGRDWALRSAKAVRLRAVGPDPAQAKSPRLGGFLGIVPGLGYAYSGEWGNALRSLFLNGIFGWAMFECADHDRWGLFAVTTFFELTWFTGSIYGGIDAAHRYNNRVIDSEAAKIMDGTATPRLDLLSLKLQF